MTPQEEHSLYHLARSSHERVAQTKTAYEAAAKERAAVFKALRAAGESPSEIARKLGLSVSRVHQIIALAERQGSE